MHELYEQTILTIEPAELWDKVEYMKEGGYRLVQICATIVDDFFELTYSFDLDYYLINLRINLPCDAEIMSITGIYWPAFVYENELKDLFGVKIKHIPADSDYDGEFFQVAQKTPWNPKAQNEKEGV